VGSEVSSVASFFISRIDSVIDAALTARMKQAQNSEERLRLGRMRGRVAIANARLAYQRYLTIYDSPRWRDMSRLGAQTQRLLWASTSTKNLEYRDVIYVEELIGADTINTIPPATFDAFRDHGEARASLTGSLQAAALTIQELDALRISMAEIADQLLDDGVAAFRGAFEALLTSIERRRIAAATPELRA
jgi:transaldolase/glucose-6-phosphate isomerase